MFWGCGREDVVFGWSPSFCEGSLPSQPLSRAVLERPQRDCVPLPLLKEGMVG